MTLAEIQNALAEWGWLSPKGFPLLFERDDKTIVITKQGCIVLLPITIIGYVDSITLPTLAGFCTSDVKELFTCLDSDMLLAPENEAHTI